MSAKGHKAYFAPDKNPSFELKSIPNRLLRDSAESGTKRDLS
jgi:hypothetical protein